MPQYASRASSSVQRSESGRGLRGGDVFLRALPEVLRLLLGAGDEVTPQLIGGLARLFDDAVGLGAGVRHQCPERRFARVLDTVELQYRSHRCDRQFRM